MPVEMSSDRFDELVGDALDEVPQELLNLLDNVVILARATCSASTRATR